MGVGGCWCQGLQLGAPHDIGRWGGVDSVKDNLDSAFQAITCPLCLHSWQHRVKHWVPGGLHLRRDLQHRRGGRTTNRLIL